MDRSLALHQHPVDGKGMCRAAARNMVAVAYLEGNKDEAERLRAHLGLKNQIALRPELCFYYALVRLVPELADMYRALDESVLAKLAGKTKRLRDPRPDYFHLDPVSNIALHGEFDEADGHEDDDERLARIAEQAGCGRERVYVFRVAGHMEDRELALCNRHVHHHRVYYTLSPRGQAVVSEVARYARWCTQRMLKGLVPDASQHKVYF